MDVYHTSTHGVALVRIYNAGLKCAARARLARSAGAKKSPKIRRLGTIVQLCRTISSQLVVKQQCLPHMSSHYGELRPTNGWDLLASLGYPCKFQFRVLAALLHGTLVVVVRQTAALNRGRHLYLAGRPSRCTTFLVKVSKILYLILIFIFNISEASGNLITKHTENEYYL